MIFGLISFFEWYLKSSYGFKYFILKIVSLIGLCGYSIYLIHQPFLPKLYCFLSILYINHPLTKIEFFPFMVLLVFTILFFIYYGIYNFIEKWSIQFGAKYTIEKE